MHHSPALWALSSDAHPSAPLLHTEPSEPSAVYTLSLSLSSSSSSSSPSSSPPCLLCLYLSPMLTLSSPSLCLTLLLHPPPSNLQYGSHSYTLPPVLSHSFHSSLLSFFFLTVSVSFHIHNYSDWKFLEAGDQLRARVQRWVSVVHRPWLNTIHILNLHLPSLHSSPLTPTSVHYHPHHLHTQPLTVVPSGRKMFSNWCVCVCVCQPSQTNPVLLLMLKSAGCCIFLMMECMFNNSDRN